MLCGLEWGSTRNAWPRIGDGRDGAFGLLTSYRVDTATAFHLCRYAAIPATVRPGVTWIVHAVQKEALDAIRERASRSRAQDHV